MRVKRRPSGERRSAGGLSSLPGQRTRASAAGASSHPRHHSASSEAHSGSRIGARAWGGGAHGGARRSGRARCGRFFRLRSTPRPLLSLPARTRSRVSPPQLHHPAACAGLVECWAPAFRGRPREGGRAAHTRTHAARADSLSGPLPPHASPQKGGAQCGLSVPSLNAHRFAWLGVGARKRGEGAHESAPHTHPRSKNGKIRRAVGGPGGVQACGGGLARCCTTGRSSVWGREEGGGV